MEIFAGEDYSAFMIRKFLFRTTAFLFLVTCFGILFTGYHLKKGIRIDVVTLGHTTVSNFFLQWQDRLELRIGTIAVIGQQKSDSPKDFSFVGKSIRGIHYIDGLFSRVTIKEILIGDLTGAFHFDQNTEQEPCFVSIISSDFALQSSLSIDQDILVFDISEVIAKQFNSKASGQIRFNIDQEQVTGALSANLAGVLPVKLDFIADRNQLSFQGKGTGRVTTITPFVELFGLKPTIQRWITDYLKGSNYTLKTVSGVIPWNKPQAIWDTFYAAANVDDCEYTFAQALDPIKGSDTDVVFSKGILTIIPHNATFYGQDTGKSSGVDINFNDPANILLTVHINTLAKGNEDILTLLKNYNISLPLKQVVGKIATDLTIVVNLNKNHVTTRADFLIDKGVVEYKRKQYGVSNSKVTLEDSNLIIERAVVSFEDLFTANVSGTLEPAVGTGDLDIVLEKLSSNIGKSSLTLNTSEGKPILKYHIRADGDSVDASASSWYLDSMRLHLGSFSSSFLHKDFSGVLSPTLLTIPPDISSKISGSFSINKKQFHLQSKLSQYQVKDLMLLKPGVELDIKYDRKLTIRTLKKSRWRLDNIAATLYPSKFTYGDKVLTVVRGRMVLGKILDSVISGRYDQRAKKGSFLLTKFHILESDIGALLGAPDGISVKVTGKTDRFILRVPERKLEIIAHNKKGWTAIFSDLAAIHRTSALLQRYSIDAGSLTISSPNLKRPYYFSADIPSRYHILVKDNKPVSRLDISGQYGDQGLTATVNKDVQIQYRDRLRILLNGFSLSIPEIIKFVKDTKKRASPDTGDKKGTSYTIEARDSSLIFNRGSRLVADRIHFKYRDGKSRMRLKHGKGRIVFDMMGEQFSVEGKELNDTFMNALFQQAHFENGLMSVAGQGTFDQFSVLFQIKNTILEEFKTLNNILAFINTVPALITFSLPEYHSRGLPVDSAVLGMNVKKGVATFESFNVDSPEIKMAGNGWIDFLGQLIEMDFKLTTQAKQNLKKIPLAGYIIAGDKKATSITLNVSGELRNPEVSNSMVKEVVSMPFEMLFRTLTLPIHLVESMVDSVKDDQKGKGKASTGKKVELEDFDWE